MSTSKTSMPEVNTIIRNVIENCKKENNYGQLIVPIDDFKKRVSFYTGCPEYDLGELLEEECSHEIDLTIRLLILKTIRKNYVKVRSPQLNQIFEKINLYQSDKDFMSLKIHKLIKKIKIPQYRQFVRAMEIMSFNPKQTWSGPVIMEDMTNFFNRYLYLTKMFKFRNAKCHIYYIDLRVIDTSLQFKKPHSILPISDGFYFLQLVSYKGIETGIFLSQMTLENFSKCIIDIIIPKLQNGSVVVIDNSPFHDKLTIKPISRYNSKQEMMNWLTEKHIPFDANMHRAELYELIDKCPNKDNNVKYNTDRILQAYSHEVVHLPLHYEDLSPTGILWKQLQEKCESLMSEEKETSGMVKDRVNNFLEGITADTWYEYEKATIELELKIALEDTFIESYLSNFLYKHNETPQPSNSNLNEDDSSDVEIL